MEESRDDGGAAVVVFVEAGAGLMGFSDVVVIVDCVVDVLFTCSLDLTLFSALVASVLALLALLLELELALVLANRMFGSMAPFRTLHGSADAGTKTIGIICCEEFLMLPSL